MRYKATFRVIEANPLQMERPEDHSEPLRSQLRCVLCGEVEREITFNSLPKKDLYWDTYPRRVGGICVFGKVLRMKREENKLFIELEKRHRKGCSVAMIEVTLKDRWDDEIELQGEQDGKERSPR